MYGEILLPTVLLLGLTAVFVKIVWHFPPAILMANVAFSAITKTASTLYLELNEVYLIETAVFSGPSGATLRQLSYNVIIFAVAMMVVYWFVFLRARQTTAKRGAPTIYLPSRVQIHWALLIAAILLAVQLVNVLTSPNIPLLTGNSRQMFWNFDIQYPLIRDAMGVLMVFVPCVASYILGVAFLRRDNLHKLLAGGLIAAYLLFLVLTGQKFNGLVVGALISAAPFFVVTRYGGYQFNLKLLTILGVLALALMLSVSVIGFDARVISQDRGGIVGGLAYRAFALQGGVHYTTDLLAMSGDGRGDVRMLFGDMELIIRTLAPPQLAEGYVRNGVNLAGSLPGIALLVGGVSGAVVICMFYGLIFGAIVAVFTKRILAGRPFDMFLLAYIYLWNNTVYARGSFDEIFSPKFLVASALLLVSGIVFAKVNSRHRAARQSTSADTAAPASYSPVSA